MTIYQVSFLKDLVDSDGRPFTTCQGLMQIKSARSRSRAIEAAEKRFARLKRARQWRIYADRFTVDVLAEKAQSNRHSGQGSFGRG